MSFLGQQQGVYFAVIFINIQNLCLSIVMSQMQKRHAEAQERTRKTGLDWYH